MTQKYKSTSMGYNLKYPCELTKYVRPTDLLLLTYTSKHSLRLIEHYTLHPEKAHLKFSSGLSPVILLLAVLQGFPETQTVHASSTASFRLTICLRVAWQLFWLFQHDGFSEFPCLISVVKIWQIYTRLHLCVFHVSWQSLGAQCFLHSNTVGCLGNSQGLLKAMVYGLVWFVLFLLQTSYLKVRRFLF